MTGNRISRDFEPLESSFTPRLPLAPPPQASARPGAPPPRRHACCRGPSPLLPKGGGYCGRAAGSCEAGGVASANPCHEETGLRSCRKAHGVPVFRGEGTVRGAGLGWEAQRVGGALVRILKEPLGRPGPAREHARPRRHRLENSRGWARQTLELFALFERVQNDRGGFLDGAVGYVDDHPVWVATENRVRVL